MSEYKEDFKGKQGHSYGLNYPVQFVDDGGTNKWVVYNVKTGEVYKRGLESWEAPVECIRQNEKLGFGCKPDIGAIDSTP